MKKLFCSCHGWGEYKKEAGARCSRPLGGRKFCTRQLRATDEDKRGRHAEGGARANSGRRRVDGTPARSSGDKRVSVTVMLTAEEKDRLQADGRSVGAIVREALKTGDTPRATDGGSRTVKASVYLTEAQRDALRMRADEVGMTVTAFVGGCIR